MTAIVAMTPGRVIGRDGALPWRLPADLRWFKRATLGHPVLMGRKTFDGLGKPLPGRLNLVVSRSAQPPGVQVVRDLNLFDPEAFQPEVFVIGGGAIYAALLPRCRQLLVTHVRAEHAGDTHFPPFEHLFRPGEVLEEHPEFWIARYVRRE